jgi:hypothetical protein
MSEESILLRVGIDENQINRSQNAIIAARTELQRLRESQTLLSATTGRNSREFIANETAIAGLNTTVRENQRVLTANNRINEVSTGSIVELRANISRLRNEYVNLSAAERENAQVGGVLQAELLAQTEAARALDLGIGVTSSSVGNYTQSIISAVDSSGIFAKAQAALATIQTVATAATGAGTIATKSFGNALIATGIGAIIILFGSLISFLTRTQRGMDLVAKATAGLSTFVAVIFDAFSDLGKQLVGTIVPTFEGLGEIIGGIIDLDFDRVRKGVDGIAEAVGKVEPINIIEVAGAAGKASAEAFKLTRQLQNVVRAEKALSLETANSRAEIETLKKAGDDITKSTEERLASTQKANSIELAQEAKRTALQEDRVRILKEQNELSSSTDEDINRVIEAEIELANIRQGSATIQTELQNKLNSLNKEAEDKKTAANATSLAERTKASEAATAAQTKEDAEALKASIELQKQVNEKYQQALEQRQIETDLAVRDSINQVRQQFADGLIDLDAYQTALDQVEALAIETRQAAVTGQLEANRTNAVIDAETRLAIETELQAELRALQDETISAGVEGQKKVLAAAVIASKSEVDLAKTKADAIIQTSQAVLGAATEAFGAQSTAGKIAASFQALIQTYSSATASYASLAGIPVVGPALGKLAAAAAIASGLANVKRINSTAPPKFAEGGAMEVSGPSHAGGGVDVALGGQTVANVEGGEGLFVMKRSAFGALKALSSFNQRHGGRSWMTGSQRHLADGGAIARSGVPMLDRTALTDTRQSFENAINSLTIVTKVSDLNRVQGEIKLVELQGDLR